MDRNTDNRTKNGKKCHNKTRHTVVSRALAMGDFEDLIFVIILFFPVFI